MSAKVEDKIMDYLISDGGKKIDLFGTDYWYSDTTHVKDRYISIGEFDKWRDIDQWNKEYQQGGEMDFMGQEDVIMPVFDRMYNEDMKTHPKIGDVSVNPKNRVMRQYTTYDDSYQNIAGGAGQDAHIWGDILDESGNKTGTQVLLKPKFNARRVEEGNLSKLFDPTPSQEGELQKDKSGRYITSKPKPPPGYGLDVPQNKSIYLATHGHLREISNKLRDMKGAELGWELKKGGVKRADHDKYIYRDADGTQYYSPKEPF